MKKYIIVMSMLFIFIFPSVALSSDSQYGIYDMPIPPSMPNWANDYIVLYDDSRFIVSNYNTWKLYVLNDISYLYVKSDELRVRSGAIFSVYEVHVRYSSQLGQYYFTDWTMLTDGLVVTKEGYLKDNINNPPYCLVSFLSNDLLTQDGYVYKSANPIPPPPMIGMEILNPIPETMGGVTKVIIPAGLVVLSILLIIALIRYLIRYLVMEKNFRQ